MVVNLEVLSHDRPVEVTGPISGVQYLCDQLGGCHRNTIVAHADAGGFDTNERPNGATRATTMDENQ